MTSQSTISNAQQIPPLSQLGRSSVSEVPPLRDKFTLADTPNAVGLARLYATTTLSSWGVPAPVVETARLLVSELTTNAVQHPKEGTAPASLFSPERTVQTFELMLEVARGTVRVAVWDRDARPPVLKTPGFEATSGRGILIVEALSRNWGHYPAHGGLPGKVVWAEIDLVPPSGVEENEEAERPPSQSSLTGHLVPGAQPGNPHLLSQLLVGVQGL
ncbi:ATP-binding protein [Streptomyces sp. cmx-4-7]|uniref:ATP-binding protein n=1 Tax=Streptomyces sp. cmx-4-7 TaxID=2790939 RepID=UPI00398149D1